MRNCVRDAPSARSDSKNSAIKDVAGFVESRRGAEGGFWLVVPAARIRVTDVTAFFAHHFPAGVEHSSDAVVKALAPATERYQEQFEHITIADIEKLDRTEQVKSTRRRKESSARIPSMKRTIGTT